MELDLSGLLAITGVVFLGACAAPQPFTCVSDPQCGSTDVGAHCESNGFCSFADTSCPSGQRYGAHAGNNLGDTCVDVVPSVCGDGTVGPQETCDPPSTCPTTCEAGAACTTPVMTGSADTCNVACEYSPVTECVTGDACCPEGCTAPDDVDCADCTDPTTWPAEWTTFEEAFVTRLNYWRTQTVECESVMIGPSSPVELDPALHQAARCHAVDMALHDFFESTGTDGSDAVARALAAGFTGDIKVETLARAYSDGADLANKLISDADAGCTAGMEEVNTVVGVGYASNLASTYKRYIDLLLAEP